MKDKLVREYLLPVKIVARSENIVGAEYLLTNKNGQVYLKENNLFVCKGRGYVLVDFGKEICGGTRLLSFYSATALKGYRMRLRFGESVEEACAEIGEKNAGNYHALRDMTIELPILGDQTYGNTGFRFLRIDFLDEQTEYLLTNVYAVYTHRDLTFQGDFECSDPLVNEIYQTARYTLFLNMQNRLWDGIKRDRLVWIGDMHPEVLAITDLFGGDECVEQAIDESIAKNPLPAWFGDIPTYSFWFIQILYEYYLKVKNEEYVLSRLPYVEGVLAQLDACVTEEGDIDYSRLPIAYIEGYFLDWPTLGTKDAKAGNRYMYIYVLKNLQKLYAQLGKTEHPLCEKLLQKLQAGKDEEVTAKQIVAFGYLAGWLSKEETAKKLTAGGAKGLSTFMSHFILKSIAESSDEQTALAIMKEYYGGMLSRGATTFWEDFDVDWLENSGRIDEFTPEGKLDLHGDFGKFCYIGFRHSFCHGWSCGPVQFLLENVVGLQVVEAGCKRIEIQPRMGDLEWCKAKFPTPYGIVEVTHTKKNGEIYTSVVAPKEVEMEVKGATHV